MRVTAVSIRIALAASMCAGAPSVLAQPTVEQPPPAPAGLRLRLVAPPVLPKAMVFVNGILNNSVAAEVFELRQTLKFSTRDLAFVRARLALAGEAAGATLVVVPQTENGQPAEAPDKAEQLQVTITAPKPLPGGPLVEFQFRQVSGREQMIRVRHVAEARDKAAAIVPDLAFSDVHVSVTKNPGMKPLKVFSCFFYMH